MSLRVHPTAEISPEANIGMGTSVWHHAQIREGVSIGQHCIIGKGVYIDSGVSIGDNVKIQNYVSVFHGVCIEDGVFVGPHVCFTNDLRPRAVNPDGSPKSTDDWVVSQTLIRTGVSLGANSTIVCGVTIGTWAMIGAGSVVTRDVPNFGLVFGNPARLRGFVCSCGEQLRASDSEDLAAVDGVKMRCPACGEMRLIARQDYELMAKAQR